MRADQKILATLQRNGRASLADLATATGLSTSACSRRLNQLLDDGTIRGVYAELAADQVNQQMLVIVQVSLHSQSIEGLAQFERAIAGIPELITCDLMSGGVDYQLRLGVRDLAAYEQLHRDTLSALPGVSRIESSFVLRPIVNRHQPMISA